MAIILLIVLIGLDTCKMLNKSSVTKAVPVESEK